MAGRMISKYLPYFNFGIASAALTFQTTVLYPRHEGLEESLSAVKTQFVEKEREKVAHYEKLKDDFRSAEREKTRSIAEIDQHIAHLVHRLESKLDRMAEAPAAGWSQQAQGAAGRGEAVAAARPASAASTLHAVQPESEAPTTRLTASQETKDLKHLLRTRTQLLVGGTYYPR